MEEKEKEILQQVEKLFMQYGIKSLTMDDIARQLGISKKTLYLYVSDKADLVEKALVLHFERDKKIVENIAKESENAIEETFEVSKHVSAHLKNIHPSIHFDLQKYYPKAWKIFREYNKEFVYNCIAKNMERGMKEGLYRDNLNPAILARIYIGRIDMVFDPEFFPPEQFNFHEVYLEMLRYHIRGIASEKGIMYMVDKFKSLKTENHIF